MLSTRGGAPVTPASSVGRVGPEAQRAARRALRGQIAGLAAELGERGCGVWRAEPRLGLIGMLAGWWQVKLSSGCP